MKELSLANKANRLIFGKTHRPRSVDAARLQWAIAHCRNSIKFGSLSFSLAASLLRYRIRDAVFMLYGWCRYCDDRIDELPHDLSSQKKLEVLNELKAATEASYHPEVASENPVFVGFGHITRVHSIPPYYPLELLAGMEMDIEGFHYRTEQDLLLYCYRVAGIVGLMSSHILTVKQVAALERAAHMGMAMQLTNIARDIFDDWQLNRVYLPDSLLAKHQVERSQLTDAGQRQALVACVGEILDWAHHLYQSGDQGLIDLPLRMAFAVQVARNVYSDIGRKVRARGGSAWDSRTWIGLPRKLVLMTWALIQTAASIPRRLFRLHLRAELRQVFTKEQAVATAITAITANQN